MRFVILGDTHRQEQGVDIPEGDVLIHTGDYDVYKYADVNRLNNWFQSLSFKHIIFVGGNHDFYFENKAKEHIQVHFYNATYLFNSGIEVDGLKIWGSPNTPEFNNWAFPYQRCSVQAQQIWEQIPQNLGLLITHGPPYQILDQNREGTHCGCEVLQREVFKKKPKNHVFGHIHRLNESFPSYTNLEGINFYNVSVLDEDYKMVYKPLILDL